MKFDLNKSLEILTATPDTLIRLTNLLSDDWVMHNEGGETWSVFDVVGHLIHGEKTDWMVRIEIIISDGANKEFVPFDRFAQFEESTGKSFGQLLNEFKSLREMNIKKLKGLHLSDGDFTKTGIHPKFGAVTLAQLISAWVVHDLGHISQISRVMAGQYKEEAGPWIEYLKILQQ